MTPQELAKRAAARDLAERAAALESSTSFAEQVGTGANEGIAGVVGLPVDAVTGAINYAGSAISGNDQPLIANPVGGSAWLEKNVLSPFMTDVQPQTDAQDWGRRFGRDLGSSVPFLGPVAKAQKGAHMLPAILGMGASSAGGATGEKIASEVWPGSPTAEFLGSVVGGSLTGVPIGLTGDAAARNRELRDYIAGTESVSSLGKRASAKYKEGHGLGIKLKPAATAALDAELRAIAKNEGLITPKGRITENADVRDVFNLLEDFQDGSIDTKQLMGLRRRIDKIAASPEDNMARIGVEMKRAFDGFVNKIAPQFADANALYTRAMRGKALQKADDLADIRASQFTQSGHDNALRAEYAALDRALVKGQGELHGLRPDQVDAVQAVSRGTPGINRARGVGRFAPKGAVTMGAMGLPVYLGHQAAGLPGALLAGTSAGAAALAGHGLANRLRQRAADYASATMRSATPADIDPGKPGSAGLLTFLLGQLSQAH